ncbi:MAG: HRDC domain-containing protein [Peptostreptococcaceae bacterium]|nr:HRDC domain-containing protein [Peptostreptococcaceae bacterium]
MLNIKYATKEMKTKVIRADQLIEYIKKVNKEPGLDNSSFKSMEDLAQSFLKMCSSNKMDYTKKYKDILNADSDSIEKDGSVIEVKKEVELKSDELVKQLRAYRLGKSREEDVKPYFLFNDKQLEDLMEKMPRNKEALKAISGFGDIKCEKYGTEIISIINKYG